MIEGGTWDTFGGSGGGWGSTPVAVEPIAPIWNINNPVGTEKLNPNWWDRNIGSIDSEKLTGALKGAAQAAGDAKALPDEKPAGMSSGGGAGAGTGGGRGNGLDQLVALLAKRREQWMQSAISGQLPKQSSTSGLLGL